MVLPIWSSEKLGGCGIQSKNFHHFFAKKFAGFIFYHLLCSTKFFLNIQEWKTKR